MNQNIETDARLLSLDAIAEAGDQLTVAGAAVAAAASADRLDVLEAALRVARDVLVGAIGEFKAMRGNGGLQ